MRCLLIKLFKHTLNAFIPQIAVAPLIFFVRVMICRDALCSIPSCQYPAFIVGLFAFLEEHWAIFNGFNCGSFGSDLCFGLRVLGHSWSLLTLIMSSLMMLLIDRNYIMALGWGIFSTVASALGLIHQKRIAPSNFVISEPKEDASLPSLYAFDTKDTYLMITSRTTSVLIFCWRKRNSGDSLLDTWK